MVTGQGRAEQDWNPMTISPQHMHLLLLSKPPESLAQTEARNQDKMELWGRGYHIPTIPFSQGAEAQRGKACLHPS